MRREQADEDSVVSRGVAAGHGEYRVGGVCAIRRQHYDGATHQRTGRGQPAKPEPAAKSEAPAKPAADSAKPVAVTDPPTSPEMVDAIDIQGKNIEVTYWHQRPQKDQDLLQEMLDQFGASNPYGIKAHPEIAGAAYDDVYNKVNAALQAGQPPEVSAAYQNQARLPGPERGGGSESVHQEQEVRALRRGPEGLLPDIPGRRREPSVPG